MRRTRSISRALAVTGALMLFAAARAALAQETPQRPYPPPEAYGEQQPAEQTDAEQEFQPFTPEQLDNLVAPIALYADPLLAQVLLASTFPDEIADAAQYVQANGTEGIDEQAWDVSVKAVAHYPTVLNMMNRKLDWTTSLGQAYAGQSTEVMEAIQRLRRMAQAQGNLVTSPEQQVVADDDYIRIWPANPRYIYVPVYDPAVVFIRPVFVRPGFHAFFSFGLPFRIGSWLCYDWDWPAWRIYYTGWSGGGWIARSRPFVQITNVYYVNPVHRRVWYGRDVLRRHPDYRRIHVYDALHPGIHYRGGDPMRRGWPRDGDRSQPGRRGVPRDGGGRDVVTRPRPLPVPTRTDAQAPRRAPVDHQPGIERPRPLPAEDRPGAERPRPAPVERRPSIERPRPAPVETPPRDVPRWAPVERQPPIERPRSAPVQTPPREVPRWAPVERQPTVERPRDVPDSRPAERPRYVPDSRPVERPRYVPDSRPVERPRYVPESRPAAPPPRVESRPAGQQPRGESRPQVQRSGGGERGGAQAQDRGRSRGEDRGSPRGHH